MDRNFSELDLQLVMFDLSEIGEERDDNVVAGVAIRESDAEAFAVDVERLAVENYGGATFAELIEEDHGDESMTAAFRRKAAERNAELVAAAERAMAEGMPETPKRHPMPAIDGKTYEEIASEYTQAERRWE